MTGEFAAIAGIRSRLPGSPGPGEVWIGDDAAVLRVSPSAWLLLTVDTSVAGVHADLTLSGLDDFGWKAMTSSISDVAAMGGAPTHAVVSVAGPPGTDLDLLYEGVAEASAEYGCPVVGGDLVNAGQLVVTVCVTGRCVGLPVLRRGASPGDEVWLTRPVGASAAGLRLLREGQVKEGRGGARRSRGKGGAGPSAEAVALMAAHRRPVAQVSAGAAARAGGARAMIDVSDGLAADAGHIADESGVGLRLDSIPVAPGATLEEALGGGEDFALVFCAPAGAPVEKFFTGLEPPARIGICTDDPSERTLSGRPLVAAGWQHEW